MAAPPQLSAKELGDQSAPPHSFFRIPGVFFFRIIRLDKPVRLLARLETETVGG